MAGKQLYFPLTIALLQFQIIWCHLCLITPRQRGDMDISKGGSLTCSRHQPPCGGQKQEEPKVEYTAGETYFIKWQQNYNHYEVGFPALAMLSTIISTFIADSHGENDALLEDRERRMEAEKQLEIVHDSDQREQGNSFGENKTLTFRYMDISILRETTAEVLETLAVVLDRNEYAQDHQKNYTAIVTIPAQTECERCVLQARYVSHKEGEKTFYQCADIRVRKQVSASQPDMLLSDPDYKTLLKAQGVIDMSQFSNPVNDPLEIYGLSYNPFNPSKVTYVRVQPYQNISELNFGLGYSVKRLPRTNHTSLGDIANDNDTSQNDSVTWLKYVDGPFLLDGVVALDYKRRVTAFILHQNGSLDDPAHTLIEIDSGNGNIVTSVNITGFFGHISGLIGYPFPFDEDCYITFSMEPAEKPGFFYFVIGKLRPDGRYTRLVRGRQPEDQYVNFQWMDVMPNSGILYVLMGNENSPDLMATRLYSYDVMGGNEYKYMELNVSQFTYQSVFQYLLGHFTYISALSPGLSLEKYPAWYLVNVDPYTGAISHYCQVTPPGIFENYYGSKVFGAINRSDYTMYHVLRVADTEADVIVTIRLVDGKCATQFSKLLNLRNVHNLSNLNGWW